MEQLAALDVKPGDQDSAAKSLSTLKNELAREQLTQEKAQTNTKTLTRAVKEMKKSVDQFAAQILSLETHVKNLNDKIADLKIALCTRELSLEWTNATKDDFQCQTIQLTKKLEGKHSFFLHHMCLTL
jgi:septal ring factor EnvC (AmiA/AmiB activator)